MNVSVKNFGSTTILKVEIEKMLGYEAKDIQKALDEAFEKDIECLVVDLSKVKFISSWGIGALMYGVTTAEKKNIDFIVAGASENLIDTFNQIKIEKILNLYPSVELALSKQSQLRI